MVKKVSKSSIEETLAFVEKLKAQWMATIDSIEDPIMIVSKDHKIEKANLAMASRIDDKVANVIGKNCYEIFAGRAKPCENCKMAVNKSDAVSYKLDEVGGDKFFDVKSQPLVVDGVASGSYVNVYRDKTDEKRMERQLIQHEKLVSIGMLAGGVAHEINNPLGGILVFSQMMLREMDKGSSHYQDAVEIEAAAQRCKVIVDDLLRYARNSSQESKIEELSIGDVVESAMSFLQMGKSSRGPALHVNLNELENLKIRGRKNNLTQVIMNIVQNGLQACRDGEYVKVDLNQTLTGVAIVIKDNGPGIPKENLLSIFDPFFTTKDPGEGTGLGLSICHRIVEDHDGQIHVKSQVNEGTTFTIEIPTITEREHSQTA